MDQLKSNESKQQVILPKRHFTIEFLVGVFAVLGVLCAAYLSVGLGNVELGVASKYDVKARFDNISGLKKGASVEIAGVQIGAVNDIKLQDPFALVTLRIDRSVKIKDDDVLMIRTKGIIGDRYVKISRGAGDPISSDKVITETESVVDLEEVIGKVIHSLTGDKEKDETETEEPKK